jgi:GTPase SAR1 family protein
LIIVFALCANKSDLYLKEKVSEKEGIEYSQSIGALFQITSARAGVGIEDLFYNIGEKLLNVNFEDRRDSYTLAITKKKTINNRKKCCLFS